LGIGASVVGEGANIYKKGYSEKTEKFPMQKELDRLGITINPPRRIKPDKYQTFKPETETEYDARRKAEVEAIKQELQNLEGMSDFKNLSPQEQEAEIRASIKAARESVRYEQPARQRQLEAQP
jgi:tRNA U38,U39,U40 pseudouridine synthase TruA